MGVHLNIYDRKIACLEMLIIEALEGYLGIQGYWQNNSRDNGYIFFSKNLKGYGILKRPWKNI